MQTSPAMSGGQLASSPRRTIATYQTYPEAQHAVDYLSDQHFPVEHIAIAGEGVRLVEQITGRVNYWKAVYNGALHGAVVGIILGFIVGLFNWVAPFASALALAAWGFLIGLIVGAIAGVILYALSRGRRDFSSVSSIQVDHYTLLADESVADEAARLLETMPR
jgi:hypothetical protein